MLDDADVEFAACDHIGPILRSFWSYFPILRYRFYLNYIFLRLVQRTSCSRGGGDREGEQEEGLLLHTESHWARTDDPE